MKLSLVIPCYNESRTLPLLLPRCAEVVAAGDGIEVVLVDNGSTDETPEMLADLLPRHPGCRGARVDENRGYGSGILFGLAQAKGRILAWTHADMQTDPWDVLEGLGLFDESSRPDALFVKGRRQGRPLVDRFFTTGMSAFETLLLGTPLWDINAQPTMFGRRFFESWRHPPGDFSLDLYAYYWAKRAGLEMRRFPVRFGARAHGVSHWNVDWSSKLRFIRRTADYSLSLRREVRRAESRPGRAGSP